VFPKIIIKMILSVDRSGSSSFIKNYPWMLVADSCAVMVRCRLYHRSSRVIWTCRNAGLWRHKRLVWR